MRVSFHGKRFLLSLRVIAVAYMHADSPKEAKAGPNQIPGFVEISSTIRRFSGAERAEIEPTPMEREKVVDN
jgi:hypothetical protein